MMKKVLATSLAVLLYSTSIVGCEYSDNTSVEYSNISEMHSQKAETSDNSEAKDYKHPVHGTDSDPDQIVEIDLHRYYGSWIIGDCIGDGYVYDDVDPNGVLIGGELIFKESEISFNGYNIR